MIQQHDSRPLVAIAAHADDVELNAGGTVAKWTDSGRPVHIIMVTDNCSGELIPPNGNEDEKRRHRPAKTIAVRRREQEAAAAMVGATMHYLNYSQRHYWNGQRAVRIGYDSPEPLPDAMEGHPPLLITYNDAKAIYSLADLLISLSPALILTQPVIDLDPEHHAVACLTWQAVQTADTAIRDAPLRFWSPGSSCVDGLFEPDYDVIEDISDWYETKLKLCAAHQSQMTHARWKMVEQRARAWGERIGVRYAEPFKTATRPGNAAVIAPGGSAYDVVINVASPLPHSKMNATL